MVTAASDTSVRQSSQSIAISGAGGLVGSSLSTLLANRGDQLTAISRSTRGGFADPILWDVEKGLTNPDRLQSIDTVVHLAGESIAAGRWTSGLKRRIRDSRVLGTRGIVQSLSQIDKRPRTLVCASAIGIYGNQGDVELNEQAAPGVGFLAEVCQQWEAEALAASELGIRVVCVRIGVVLNPAGGALSKMLLPFRLGLGGRIGNGRQYWSWIGLTDLVRAIVHCIDTESLEGPVNAVSPYAVTNSEFTRVLGKVLHRPTIFPMPAVAAKLALGEMANELLLSSARVVPAKLLESGFRFDYPQLVDCLSHELKR